MESHLSASLCLNGFNRCIEYNEFFSVMRRRQAYLHIYGVLPAKAVRITVVSTSNDYLLKAVIFHL